MNVVHVLFKVGGAEYVLPFSDVLHMESFTGATKVPGSAPDVVGLMQVRGRVLPVVDLRSRFGLPTQEPTADSRVVIVHHAGRTVALLADSAREVVKLDPETFRAAPEMLANADDERGFVKAVAQTGKRLVMLLDLPKLIAQGEEPGQKGESHGNRVAEI